MKHVIKVMKNQLTEQSEKIEKQDRLNKKMIEKQSYAKKGKISKYARMVEKANDETYLVRADNLGLKKEIGILSKENYKLQNTVQRLEAENIDFSKSANEDRTRRLEVDKLMKNLRCDMENDIELVKEETIQECNKNLRRAEDKSKEKLQQLKKKFQEAATRAAKYRANFEQVSASERETVAISYDQQEEIQKQKIHVESLEQKLTQMTNEITIKKNEISHLTMQLQEKTKREEILASEIKEKVGIILEITSSVNLLKTNENNWVQKVDSLEKGIRKAYDEKEKINKTLCFGNEKRNKLESTISELRARLQKEKVKSEGMKNEVELISSALHIQKKESEENARLIQETYDQMAKKEKRLLSKIDFLKKSVSSHQNQISEKDSIIKKYKKSFTDLKKSFEVKKANFFSNAREELENKISENKEKHQELLNANKIFEKQAADAVAKSLEMEEKLISLSEKLLNEQKIRCETEDKYRILQLRLT